MEEGTISRKSRIALVIQYDGTLFNGFQLQAGGRTVQGELEKAVHVLTRQGARVHASGRTDSGVHALGQVVHFDIELNFTLQKLCIALNGILPKDISIKNGYIAPEKFHSRYSAISREYRYLIYNHPLRSTFMMYRAMWEKDILDVGYLRDVTSHLVGEHDFASFCRKISANEGTVRRITGIDVEKKDEMIEIRIRGNAFLHNMIRIIIGTIVMMHKEGRDPEYIKEILDKKDRDASGPTAPPYGLYLSKVEFYKALESFESAF